MFILMLLTVLVSLPFVCVLIHRPEIPNDWASFFRHRASRLVGILFLAALASCNSAPSTPLAHSSPPMRNASALFLLPAVAALKSDDWTTYHHDNARTGYLANEPDPRRLIHAWTAKLGHAVYAEPLDRQKSLLRQSVGWAINHLPRRDSPARCVLPWPKPAPLL